MEDNIYSDASYQLLHMYLKQHEEPNEIISENSIGLMLS